MKKHVPVLLNEVINELESIDSENLIAIDCTLGQAGHSWEIYQKLQKGVLLSIDQNQETIEWTASNYNLPPTLKFRGTSQYLQNTWMREDGDKKWIIVKDNFQNLDKILNHLGYKSADFILADLGFSNFELNQNIGISFSDSNQDLNMNYSSLGLSAKDVLNEFKVTELEAVFKKYFDRNELKGLIQKITSYRSKNRFEIVSDLQYAFRNLPQSFLVKATQALRSFVNDEELALETLCKQSKEIISEIGKVLVITFNPLEEEIVNKIFEKHQTVVPNINEIIKNPQSRSAKLHIYKKTKYSNSEEEKQP